MIDVRPEKTPASDEAMKIAWGMYEKLGFKRSDDLYFLQKGLPVFGFRLSVQ